ncbi:MAG: biotin/lipoyl-containing protein [Candidatus Omnitrophota bacterium]|nr:biotin/lipoyl-containing protein [Candidatus Omnitrophota bacterium]
MTNVYLPELGEGIEKATVSYWYFQEGQEVKESEDLVELTTDKATFNVPAPVNGVVVEILVQEGDSVNLGEPLAVIDESLASDKEEDESA